MPRSRRILMASEFWFGASADGLAHGLRRLGWDICAIDQREHFIASSSRSLRLAARVLRRFSVASYNHAILRSARQLQPRAFLTIKGNYVERATLASLRAMGVTTINYYPDFHFQHPGFDVATIPLYDRFFTTKSFQLDALRMDYGARDPQFLHHGYSSHVHYPRLTALAESDYATDCLYVGAYSRHKLKWLLAIRRGLPDVSLTIIGNGWRDAVRGTGLEPCHPGYPLTGDAYARAVQTARVNLAVHAGPFGPRLWEDQVSTRTFEIPACRGFMLHVDNDETRTLFTPDEEIGVFKTEDELCGKLAFYLARPELRAAMIERAFARCVPAYSYDARALEISRAVERGA